MPIHTHIEPSGLIISRISGTLQAQDVNAAKSPVFEHLMLHGAGPMLMHLDDGFLGLDSQAHWDDIPEDQFIQQHITRFAFVGDVRWRDTAMLFFFQGMVPVQMEFFPPTQYELAHAWLTAQ